MFFTRTSPPDVAPDALRAVRLAINTPVVSTGDLPVGPARAALAVHVLASGQPDVTIAVRSLRDGALALYGFEGSFSAEGSVSVALDAALSFAEAMGFLFDEDLIGDATDAAVRHAAWLRWREIAEGSTPLELEDSGGKATAEGASGGDDALLLEDLAEELELEPELAAVTELEPELAAVTELEPELAAVTELEPSAPLPPEPSAPPKPETVAPALTKFRAGGAPKSPSEAKPSPADEGANDTPAARGAALGRLPLVKRRRGGRPALDPLLRLLGSF